MMSPSRAPGVQGALLVLAALLFGCGGGHDAVEKELGELRAEVAKLRATQASLTERLDAIDIERGAFAKGAASATSGTSAPAAPPPGPSARPASDRPDLDVVRLSPNEGDGDVDNDPSRPVVRATGDASAARQTLSNKNIGPHSKKGVAVVNSKKTDGGDARPAVKP
jgi:hypothetical protein